MAIAIRAGSTDAAAAGDDAGWSEVSNGLRARLSMRRSHVSHGTCVVAVYLELNNVREQRFPMLVDLDTRSITYDVTDGDGNGVPMGPRAGSGSAFDKFELMLPHDSSMRFRLGPFGQGIPADQAALVDLGLKFGWALPRDGKAYYLHAVLELPEVRESRGDRGTRWHGRLDIPRVRIPTEPEPLDPATLGPIIDELGAKMLAHDFDVEARHRLSLIEDPRVIPWYVKAVKTKSYELKYSVLHRLARFEGDAALEGLKVAMTTQGDDIANCRTADDATSYAARVRGAAAGALARSPHKQAKSLLFSMEEDPARGVRLTVLQTAARMDTPESLALLERRVNDGDAMVRGEAVRLLELRKKGTTK